MADDKKPGENKEDEKKEPKKDEPEEESSQNSTDLIDKANEAAERLEKANLAHENLLKKQEKMQVEKTLGGETEAGTPKEESPEEYAKKVIANDVEEVA